MDIRDTDGVLEVCPSCKGAGVYDIGDCEAGVWGICRECEGYGTLND